MVAETCYASTVGQEGGLWSSRLAWDTRETLSQKNKGWECQSVRLCTAHHKKEIL